MQLTLGGLPESAACAWLRHALHDICTATLAWRHSFPLDVPENWDGEDIAIPPAAIPYGAVEPCQLIAMRAGASEVSCRFLFRPPRAIALSPECAAAGIVPPIAGTTVRVVLAMAPDSQGDSLEEIPPAVMRELAGAAVPLAASLAAGQQKRPWSDAGTAASARAEYRAQLSALEYRLVRRHAAADLVPRFARPIGEE